MAFMETGKREIERDLELFVREFAGSVPLLTFYTMKPSEDKLGMLIEAYDRGSLVIETGVRNQGRKGEGNGTALDFSFFDSDGHGRGPLLKAHSQSDANGALIAEMMGKGFIRYTIGYSDKIFYVVMYLVNEKLDIKLASDGEEAVEDKK
ncbi:MAG: hypothetical protein QXW10_03325, partial [Candidatus Micrarchaeaceae archaeon]